MQFPELLLKFRVIKSSDTGLFDDACLKHTTPSIELAQENELKYHYKTLTTQ